MKVLTMNGFSPASTIMYITRISIRIAINGYVMNVQTWETLRVLHMYVIILS